MTSAHCERLPSVVSVKTTLGIPHASIRRIVRNMPAGRTAAEVRADIRLRCNPENWPEALIRKAAAYAVKVYQEARP